MTSSLVGVGAGPRQRPIALNKKMGDCRRRGRLSHLCLYAFDVRRFPGHAASSAPIIP
ncbi:hypothetical protein CLOSTASPAR_06265 [[Clostridium] asparagiforme DSM 15981]|uniref:Uncharacterized protein n=1 Tax=[Clostridium] asparagiforme DSM 15981 TaxID=518636 RepID=C0DAG3_9FIRM|nr:hypothetical protein CLOSTASPAR_06265 [[Clostridium] asparagiforme DSM 15981]